MADKPIIFSAPMVRALLTGTKTQTRRVLKEQPAVAHAVFSGGRWQWRSWKTGCFLGDLRPPYAPGDRLYVREAHKLVDQHCDYRADWPDVTQHLFRWRPSIHMPRWASRITLTVTEVRVQRLQEISEADAVAEGIVQDARVEKYGGRHFVVPGVSGIDSLTASRAFRDLWNSLHGPDAWDQNPWVVAVSFTVRQGNIDT